MEMDLSYYSKIDMSSNEKVSSGLPLNISGVSVRAGYIKSKNFIIPQKELENISKSLAEGIDGTGAYILKDHGYRSAGFMVYKSVDALAGKIDSASVNGKDVMYKGRIEDADLAHKIRKGLVSTSSAGLRVNRVYCSICGEDYGKCNHRLGTQYPDENLHESVSEYLEDMDGIPTAALVGEDIRAIEQSVVLFPAIPSASARPELSLEFSEDTETIINEIENRTDDDEKHSECSLNEDDIIEKLTKMVEERVTFNNQSLLINARKTMSEEKISELEKTLSSLIAQKKELETTVNDLTAKLDTTNDIVDKYKKEEKERHALWKQGIIDNLVSVRKDLGLPDKIYSDASDEVLKSDLELLSSLSNISSVKGAVSDNTDDKEKLKAEWRKRIFKK